MPILALFRTLSLLQRIGVTVGLILAAWGAWVWFWHHHDNAVIENHEAAITEAVATASAEASVAATEAVTETRNKVENDNDKARKAARDSSDPLRDGLRSLHH